VKIFIVPKAIQMHHQKVDPNVDPGNKKGLEFFSKPLFYLVPLRGIEPLTY